METWFQMEDGTVGDPHEIVHGADGKLVHKDGRSVAYGPLGPRSRGGVDAEAERARAKQPSAAAPVPAAAPVAPLVAERPKPKDMKPEEPKQQGYRTRESKAD